MTISTYAGLKTAITSWLDIKVADLSTVVDDLVTIGEARINREARTRDQEASMSTAIASGVVAVPSDYVAMKFAYIDGTPTQILERRTAEDIYAKYSTRSASGKPTVYAREGSNFIFGPYPNSGYTMKGVYYKKFSALSSAAHALFTNNPDLYLFACLAESEIVIGRDERVPLWEAKYKLILADVNGQAKAEDVSGSTLRVR